MLAATVLLVGFATRGAMASNRAIVEVLHFVGAKNRYIAGQFQRHFLRLGMRGRRSWAAALRWLVFLALRYCGGAAGRPAPRPRSRRMFGTLALGPDGYAGMLRRDRAGRGRRRHDVALDCPPHPKYARISGFPSRHALFWR